MFTNIDIMVYAALNMVSKSHSLSQGNEESLLSVDKQDRTCISSKKHKQQKDRKRNHLEMKWETKALQDIETCAQNKQHNLLRLM